LEVSTWSHKISAYAQRADPDTDCDYFDSPYFHTNACGLVGSLAICDTGGLVDRLPSFRINWGIQSDGTVSLSLELYSTFDGDGNYVPPVNHTVNGLDLSTWYLSPIVFTLSGVTYTIEVCADPQSPFPEWPLTEVFYELRDYTGAITRSTGTLLCGAECYPYAGLGAAIRWTYNIYTDKVTLFAFLRTTAGIYVSGTLVVDYNDGAWASDDYTMLLSSRYGVPDYPVSIIRVTSCDTTTPPACPAYTCFPVCLANSCDGGATVNASALFGTVTGDCPCLNGDFNITYDSGNSWFYGSIGDPLGSSCFLLEVWYFCDSGNLSRRVKITMGGGIIDDTQTVSLTCDVTDNVADTATYTSSAFIAPLCSGSGNVILDVYTNN